MMETIKFFGHDRFDFHSCAGDDVDDNDDTDGEDTLMPSFRSPCCCYGGDGNADYYSDKDGEDRNIVVGRFTNCL